MSRTRCSLCRQSTVLGQATVYAATYYPEGDRVSHRLTLCNAEAHEYLIPLIIRTPLDPSMDDDGSCVLCHASTAEDAYYYWFVVYPPHGERTDHEALLCFKCHALTTEWIAQFGKRLTDRDRPAREAVKTPEAWAFLAG